MERSASSTPCSSVPLFQCVRSNRRGPPQSSRRCDLSTTNTGRCQPMPATARLANAPAPRYAVCPASHKVLPSRFTAAALRLLEYNEVSWRIHAGDVAQFRPSSPDCAPMPTLPRKGAGLSVNKRFLVCVPLQHGAPHAPRFQAARFADGQLRHHSIGLLRFSVARLPAPHFQLCDRPSNNRTALESAAQDRAHAKCRSSAA